MFSDVSVIACKAATAIHEKMKLLSSDSIIIGMNCRVYLIIQLDSSNGAVRQEITI